MKTDSSKGFQSKYKKGEKQVWFSRPQPVNRSRQASDDLEIDWEKLLMHIGQGLVKLFVAIKFLLFTFLFKPLSAVHLPWFKIGFLSLLAFFLMKNDFRFSVNMDEPTSKIVKDEQKQPERPRETWFSQLFSATGGPGVARKIDLDDPDRHPFSPLPSDDLSDQKAKRYIMRFAKIAVTEMHKYGIPASVKMAQALLESNSGESRLTTVNNNHFGIKCFSKKCKKGHCSNFGDDHHKDFFRAYSSAWESWRSHSQMLVSGRYQKLLENDKDYKAWAYGLKELGYATDRKYSEKLIETIEKYKLYLLDEI